MAYYTGLASSPTDLLNAIKAACTDNGWTISGSIFQKNGCFVNISTATNLLSIYGGTGTASGDLTGKNTTKTPITVNGNPVMCASMMGVGSAIIFPVEYNIHIFNNPDEVYVVINYSVDSYSYLAFGQLKNPLSGTGNWYAGLCGNPVPKGFANSVHLNESVGSSGASDASTNTTTPAGIFTLSTMSGTFTNSAQSCNSFVHHNLDNNVWSQAGTTVGDLNTTMGYAQTASMAQSWLQYVGLTSKIPSKWNDETILLPIQPSIYRPSNKISILGTLSNARYVRLNNYEPKQILTLGSEKWRVYPWFKRNITSPNDSQSSAHSATFGWAIRYDGA